MMEPEAGERLLESEFADMESGKGPSWAWLAGAFLTILMGGAAWWGTSVWSELSTHTTLLQQSLTQQAVISDNLASIKLELAQQRADREHDHEMLLEDDALLRNWVHPDHAGVK